MRHRQPRTFQQAPRATSPTGYRNTPRYAKVSTLPVAVTAVLAALQTPSDRPELPSQKQAAAVLVLQ